MQKPNNDKSLYRKGDYSPSATYSRGFPAGIKTGESRYQGWDNSRVNQDRSYYDPMLQTTSQTNDQSVDYGNYEEFPVYQREEYYQNNNNNGYSQYNRQQYQQYPPQNNYMNNMNTAPDQV